MEVEGRAVAQTMAAHVFHGEFFGRPILVQVNWSGVKVIDLDMFLTELCGEDLHMVHGELWPAARFFLKQPGEVDLVAVSLRAEFVKPDEIHDGGVSLNFHGEDGKLVCGFFLPDSTVHSHPAES